MPDVPELRDNDFPVSTLMGLAKTGTAAKSHAAATSLVTLFNVIEGILLIEWTDIEK
jgi:hypothetical protein